MGAFINSPFSLAGPSATRTPPKGHAVALVLVSLLPILVLAQSPDVESPRQGLQAATALPNNQGHPLAVNLARAGALQCVERANQVARFVDPSTISQTLLQVADNNPNTHLVMATMVVPSDKKTDSLVSVALAPNQANGCGGSYHAISYLDAPCDQATARTFPNIKFNRMNNTSVSVAVINRTMWVLAMSAGKGCVIQKEEVLN